MVALGYEDVFKSDDLQESLRIGVSVVNVGGGL